MPETEIKSMSGNPVILKGAVLSGIINAVINGGIQWYLLADSADLPLTVDGITNEETTVFGAAVPLAVSLAMILTFAVLWQRVMGSVLVSLPAAVLILGLVAGLVSAMVNYMTIRAATAQTV